MNELKYETYQTIMAHSKILIKDHELYNQIYTDDELEKELSFYKADYELTEKILSKLKELSSPKASFVPVGLMNSKQLNRGYELYKKESLNESEKAEVEGIYPYFVSLMLEQNNILTVLNLMLEKREKA